MQLSLPKELTVTHPLGPPLRASVMLLPSPSISLMITSVLNTEGWPVPVRMTSQARFRKRSGFLLLIWTQALGWVRCISSTTSSMMYETSLTPSVPSDGLSPPILIKAKSV